MKTEHLFGDLVQQLVESGLAHSNDLEGCSSEEIAALEAQFAVALPYTYKAFLGRLGRRSGEFLAGSDFHCDAVASLRADALRLLKECNAPFQLDPDDFVFCAHQGYQFLFFSCSAGDDPPIRLYIEGDPKPDLVASTFSDWFKSCVADEIDARRQ